MWPYKSLMNICMRHRAGQLFFGLLFTFVLSACVQDGSFLSVGEDSAPTEQRPIPTVVPPGSLEFTEYEHFLWTDRDVDGYFMEYRQQCGDYQRADDIRAVWVNGSHSRSAIDSNVRTDQLLTIDEILEIVVARGRNDTLALHEAEDAGVPTFVSLENPEQGEHFCFGLVGFQESTRDDDGRMQVPLLREANAESRASTSFSVAIPSCNGGPEATVEESSDTIFVDVTTWIPDGNDRGECLDEVFVELDAPIGNREIWDRFVFQELPLITNEILDQPQQLQQIGCDDDVADCRAAFQIDSMRYAITCIGVDNDVVVNDLIAFGAIGERTIDAFQISGTSVEDVLAVNLTSGDCSNRAAGPITGVERAWSVAVRLGANPDQISLSLCDVADLSNEQRALERCDRFE